jgi:hypothetical protein
MINLKPSTHIVYPPFKNGLYMEEYFSKYWENEEIVLKEKYIYIDAFWHNIFHLSNGKITETMNEITPNIIEICKKAETEGKIVFTLCQWDDGIQLQCDKPSNFIVFSIGGSNNKNDCAIQLPLIAEDKSFRLSYTPRIKYNEKTILCSFVGTLTHNVREKMFNKLKHDANFKFIIKQSWTLDIPENMAQTFINTTQSSKFALAPRGYGISSFRFFEIMQLGVIPIYIYDIDNINGLPYQDIIDYTKFTIVICIDQISNLPNILTSITEDKYNDMLLEMEKVSSWYTPQGVCNYVKKYLINNY